MLIVSILWFFICSLGIVLQRSLNNKNAYKFVDFSLMVEDSKKKS